MTRLFGKEIYDLSPDEKNFIRNTEQHQAIKKELYSIAYLPPKEVALEIIAFKARHPLWFV
ncbi:hypothetical protein LCGC14_0566830 [marine sediment metagenome]|uniref:Uncharacterized protein n=1 Tax=marine sediment metagenome TaxID=412755 RepID=A0A0F9U6N5_9ZZZZ